MLFVLVAITGVTLYGALEKEELGTVKYKAVENSWNFEGAKKDGYSFDENNTFEHNERVLASRSNKTLVVGQIKEQTFLDKGDYAVAVDDQGTLRKLQAAMIGKKVTPEAPLIEAETYPIIFKASNNDYDYNKAMKSSYSFDDKNTFEVGEKVLAPRLSDKALIIGTVVELPSGSKPYKINVSETEAIRAPARKLAKLVGQAAPMPTATTATAASKSMQATPETLQDLIKSVEDKIKQLDLTKFNESEWNSILGAIDEIALLAQQLGTKTIEADTQLRSHSITHDVYIKMSRLYDLLSSSPVTLELMSISPAQKQKLYSTFEKIVKDWPAKLQKLNRVGLANYNEVATFDNGSRFRYDKLKQIMKK